MNDKQISDFDILVKGQLTVNLPVIIVMVFAFLGLLEFAYFSLQQNLLIAFVIGWITWSFLVRKWILWATKKNVSDERLLRIGKPGMLVWSINTIQTVTIKNKTPWI
ncbi:hypothetical protein [Flavobacterium adhaerens]|uniref:hypothetical protein n=1 Tax=Flavobacterium adhaerens TaxID=3149043 RepID=UPI0032B5E744